MVKNPQFSDDIDKKKVGDRLAAQEVNALITGPRQAMDGAELISGGGANASRNKQQSVLRGVWGYTSETISPYSIFGASGTPSASDDPPRITIDRIGGGYSGSPLAYFTNGSIQLEPGWNYVTPVSAFDVFELQLDLAGTIPDAGGPCGVSPGTYILEGNRFGFVYLGPGGASGRIKVLRVAEPASIIGIVSTDISAYDPKTDTLGWGWVKLLERQSVGDKLVKSVNPETGETPFELVVFGTCDWVIKAGCKVECHNALGIGLIAHEMCTPDCSSSSSSEESSSTSEPSESSESSSAGCIDAINGIELDSIPLVKPADASYVLGLDSDGCMVRIDLTPCKQDGSA